MPVKNTSLKILLALVLASSSAACSVNEKWRSLNQEGAPWVGPDRRAEFQERDTTVFLPLVPLPPSGGHDYRYFDRARGKSYNPEMIGKRAEAYLQKQQAIDAQLAGSLRGDKEREKAFRLWKTGNDPGNAVPFRMTLICLDPEIIVVTTETSMYRFYGGVSLVDLAMMRIGNPTFDKLPRSAGALIKDTERGGGEQVAVLPGGVIPSTELDSIDGAMWFSPSLKQGPFPLEFDAQGTARIAVRWGELLIRQEGNIYSVNASQ